jgi:hypothetical protein
MVNLLAPKSSAENSHDQPHALRPEFPPEAIARRKPSFQFPKSLTNPVLCPLLRLIDGLSGQTRHVQQHLVICGFPRSGTTLGQLMIETCVSGIRTYGKERRALEIARYGRKSHPGVVTKRPKDLFLISEIRKFYQRSETAVRFVVFSRDPRAVLTSNHFSDPGDYYVSPEYWRQIYAHWKWAIQRPDVLSVRYEDLIQSTDTVEDTFSEFSGWQTTRRFRDFLEAVPAGFDGRALNGLRPVDPGHLNRWRREKHRSRLRSLLTDLMPDLPQVLIDLGYENSTDWTADWI